LQINFTHDVMYLRLDHCFGTRVDIVSVFQDIGHLVSTEPDFVKKFRQVQQLAIFLFPDTADTILQSLERQVAHPAFRFGHTSTIPSPRSDCSCAFVAEAYFFYPRPVSTWEIENGGKQW
jgi:hypothetical protein